VEDASFLRLQNVTLGYTLDLAAQSMGRITSARVYVSGDNLVLITPYSGYDPEVFTDALIASRGIDYLSYPRARTFTLGVRLGF
jgi:iron complex outermembrane receptor protein